MYVIYRTLVSKPNFFLISFSILLTFKTITEFF